MSVFVEMIACLLALKAGKWARSPCMSGATTVGATMITVEEVMIVGSTKIAFVGTSCSSVVGWL